MYKLVLIWPSNKAFLKLSSLFASRAHRVSQWRKMYECEQGVWNQSIHYRGREQSSKSGYIWCRQRSVDKMNIESSGGCGDSCSFQGLQENRPGDTNLIPTKRGNSTAGVPYAVVLPSPFRLGSWCIAIKFLFGGVFSIQWWKIVQQLKCLLVNKSHSCLFVLPFFLLFY